ncbi:phosphotransferase [Streptomyces sp. NPDC055400]
MPNIITPRPEYRTTAVRPAWADLPPDVRQLISRQLGGIEAARPSAGSGFTQGFAAVIDGTDGTQFIKAASATDAPQIADCYRREAQINPALPNVVPAPRLKWIEDTDGWVVLGFDAVKGSMPDAPWKPNDLGATLDAYTITAEALSTAPSGLQQVGLKPLGETDDFDDWRNLAGGTTPSAVLPAWMPAALVDILAVLESGWQQAVTGDSVLHYDLRQDNILIDTSNTAWICDWNWPVLGASWFDLTLLLATAHADGHDASSLFKNHPAARGAHDEQLDAALAALAGVFLVSGAQPARPESPHLRQHQTWCGEVTLRWLADRQSWRL